MSAIAVELLLTWTNRMSISITHHVTALIFYNITCCYGKHVALFAVVVATGDIIKYQSFVYGSFVWEIHVRYDNITCVHLLEVSRPSTILFMFMRQTIFCDACLYWSCFNSIFSCSCIKPFFCGARSFETWHASTCMMHSTAKNGLMCAWTWKNIVI